MALKFGVWSSPRLCYRALEESDETGLLADIYGDPEGRVAAAVGLPTPPSSKSIKNRREQWQAEMLGVAICLSSSDASNPSVHASQAKWAPGEPIGFLTLGNQGPKMQHHGKTELAIGILPAYQSKGYGTEALQWALYWGFVFARLHRIELSTIQFNDGARRLYERVGFREEGVKREAEFKYGRWWDVWEAAILEHEWREKYASLIVDDAKLLSK